MAEAVIILWIIVVVVEIPPRDIVYVPVAIVIHTVTTCDDKISRIGQSVVIARLIDTCLKRICIRITQPMKPIAHRDKTIAIRIERIAFRSTARTTEFRRSSP